MVPDTVQLMVDVAGLCSRAPALEVIRPAGMAPRRRPRENARPTLAEVRGSVQYRPVLGDPLVGAIYVLVYGGAVLCFQPVLGIPDIE